MIKHIVMWKLKDEANGQTKQENALKIKQKLEALVGVIEEIKALEVGVNCNTEDEAAYDACLISEFETMDALARYQVPRSTKSTAFVKEVRLARTCVDFEF